MQQDDSMLSTPSSTNDDIDESMITSASHDENEMDDTEADADDNLFPAPTKPGTTTTGTTKHSMTIGRPRTPQNDHLNASAPGELSPPRSQKATRDTAHAITRTAKTVSEDVDDLDLSPTNPNLGHTATTAISTGTGTGSSANTVPGAAVVGPQDGTTTTNTEWKAGYGWKNKKAQTDMQKARDNMTDRDFSLKPYGDVLAHRIGVEAGARR